jgi:hypothetical protein
MRNNRNRSHTQCRLQPRSHVSIDIYSQGVVQIRIAQPVRCCIHSRQSEKLRTADPSRQEDYQAALTKTEDGSRRLALIVPVLMLVSLTFLKNERKYTLNYMASAFLIAT